MITNPRACILCGSSKTATEMAGYSTLPRCSDHAMCESRARSNEQLERLKEIFPSLR